MLGEDEKRQRINGFFGAKFANFVINFLWDWRMRFSIIFAP
jgi:hypothetical protein